MNPINVENDNKVAGIILAAGGSTRFGKIKQLIQWQGVPLIRHVALRAKAAELDPVIVVTGASGKDVRLSINDLNVEIVENPDWQQGQSTSIKIGLRQLGDRAAGCIFLLADQPQVTEAVLFRLMEEFRQSQAPIIAPLVLGQRSNPVCFSRITFPDLLKIQGDVGGRAIFDRHKVHWLEWLDQNLLIDIDTPDDLERLVN